MVCPNCKNTQRPQNRCKCWQRNQLSWSSVLPMCGRDGAQVFQPLLGLSGQKDSKAARARTPGLPRSATVVDLAQASSILKVQVSEN